MDDLQRETPDPVRRRRCLAELFGEEEERPGEPTAAEERLLEGVEGPLGEVVEGLSAGEREATSLEELSRRVFDPLPAPLVVTLPFAPFAVEGFARRTDGSFVAAEASLWQAMARLVERWPALGPVADLEALREGESRVDLDALLVALAAGEPAPTTAELADALLAGLRPPAAYSLSWPVAAAPQGPARIDWEALAPRP